MNLKALITTLVLGSSSLAMAKPVTVIDARASVSVGWNAGVGYENRPTVIDHRHPAPAPVVDDCDKPVYQAPLPAPVAVRPIFFNPNNTIVGANASTYVGSKPYLSERRDFRRWIALTEPTRIDSGREFITIGPEAGRFQQIKLFNNRGTSHIFQVAIEFVGGGTQKVRIDQLLTSGNPMTIDLAGGYRAINRIIVYGSTNQGSAYQVLAL